nr:hypothetical protein [Tanacetum cinerariifolium]
MLADSLLPIAFWAKAVNIACYVQNRVLVTKPHNKMPYEVLLGRTPSIGFIRPFGCLVTILNTLDPLGKFDGKADEGFLVGYSVNSKAFRVFNSRTRIIQETLHINFLENQPNVARNGPKWLFNIDTLTQSMNYQPVVVGNQPNHNAGIKENINADPQNTDDVAAFYAKKNKHEVHVSPSSSNKPKKHDEKAKKLIKERSNFGISGKYFVDPSNYPDDPDMPALLDIVYLDDEGDVGGEADLSNLETNIFVIPILTTRVHKDHHVTQIIGDLTLAPQTRSMARMVKEQGGVNQINDEDFHTCMFTCFLSQEEPKRVHQALKDPSWIEAMQEELLQFKMQKVWVLVDLPKGKRAIGHTKEEGIDYDEVFAPVVRLKLSEEVHVCQSLRFKDPDYPDKIYKVVKALYGLYQASRAWYETLVNYLLENGFQRAKIEQTLFIKKQQGLQVKQKNDGIFISQDKYVAEILRKFGFTDVKSASTPIETEKPLLKDPDGEDVHVAYSDSDYAGASLDRKSTTGGCQFLECLPNEEIFTKLARMGYEKSPPKLTFYKAFFSAQWKFLIHILVQCISAKRTTWNEFSCSMASAVICLATRRKFNFSKYIFDSMVRNVDSPSKFLMYSRFLQVIINAQVRKDDHNAAIKEVSVAEPTMFDDEEVTMTMALTLIKMKAKKTRLLDEQMAKRLHDEEIKQVAAREKQEKDDLEKAKVLQKQYVHKQENIDWNVVVEQMQEKHFNNIRKYQIEVLGSHSTQDTPTDDPKEMSKEDVKNMLEIVPVSEFKVEALQVKYPLIDWEIYSEGSRSYLKIIRVGGITQAYQSFEYMLKYFTIKDLDVL